MERYVDVAVIGAGHAGLNAIKEIRKVTDNYVLINGGALGTTCARIGCMPSKVAIHLAETFQNRKRFDTYGIEGANALALNQAEALEHVRDLRDTFVDLVLANTTDEMDSDHLIIGYAEFLGPNTVKVNDDHIHANAFVIATGAQSVIPAQWQEKFSDGILTVENIFEQDELPRSIAVLGLGPIGIEIGQALHRLGVEVTGLEKNNRICHLGDPMINDIAMTTLSREFPIWAGQEPQISKHGDEFIVKSGDRETRVEKLFLALGRKANIEPLRLDRLNVPLNSRGVPDHDPKTLKFEGLSIYLAGDATGGPANLQVAAAQGKVAGYNAAHKKPRTFKPGTHMHICFTDPNIAVVGSEWSALDADRTLLVAQRRFGPVGRAMIMGQNRGMLRVYADRRSGRLLGAAMFGVRSEHLAHLISWAVQSEMTVNKALEMPFYHPVIEEALQEVLIDLKHGLEKDKKTRRLSFFSRERTFSFVSPQAG